MSTTRREDENLTTTESTGRESSRDIIQREESVATEEVGERPAVRPAVDIYENEDGLLLTADLPGVSQENLDVRIDQSHLLIEGRREPRFDGANLVGGAELVDFRRAFRLPKNIDPEGIDADLTQGVLSVRIPRPAAQQSRRIPVNVR